MSRSSNNFDSLPRLYKGEKNLNYSLYSLKRERIVIPIYKRNYRWTPRNVEYLLKDIKKHYQEGKKIWLGTILINVEKDGSIVLIDGQQRLITMFLVFKKFMPNFSINDIHDENSELKIYENNSKSVNSSWLTSYWNWFIDKPNIEKNKFLRQILRKIDVFTDLINPEFIEYLQESVCCTILVLENNYESFENLNAKNVPLQLVEKCVAFLTDVFGNKTNSNHQEFVAKIELLKFLLKSEIKSQLIVQRFVDINANVSEKDYFGSFKKIIDRPGGLTDFFAFLKQVQNLESEKKDTFVKWYFWNVCQKDYWLIYVCARLKWENSSEFLSVFLEEVWKFDLIRHLNRLAKTSIKNQILSFVKSKNFGINSWRNLMLKIMQGSPEGISITSNNTKTISFAGSARDIYYDIPNFGASRFTCLFYLLYVDEPWKSINLEMFFDSQNANKIKKIAVDHLISQKPNQNYRVSDLENDVNSFKNLWLLKDSANSNLSNLDIDKKIREYHNLGVSAPLFCLNAEVAQDWISVSENFPNSSISQKVQIIKAFWEKRETKLDHKINLIKRKYLTINL